MQDFVIRAIDLLVSPALHSTESAHKDPDFILDTASRRALVLQESVKQGCNSSVRLYVWRHVMPLLPGWFEECVELAAKSDRPAAYLEPFVRILGAWQPALALVTQHVSFQYLT